MNWRITDRGDQDVRRLADRHYTRQTIGATGFTRNGQSLVFITEDLRAAWITFRPTPGKAIRQDKLDAWECALFRNEGDIRSSLLIREAVMLTCALWGPFPSDGFITFVKPEAVGTDLKGYCYRRAGWVTPWCKRPACEGKHKAHSGDGKPMFRAPMPARIPSWSEWQWHMNRGGGITAHA